jgi:hypothetical protein
MQTKQEVSMFDIEQFAIDFEQAHEHFYGLIFKSVAIVASIFLSPMGFFIPVGPMQARILYCAVIAFAVFLLFKYFKEVRSRWIVMDRARAKRNLYIATRSQQTTIVAEPVGSSY